MIKVHYEHPPRKWDFYVGYLLRMFIICLPIGILFLLWIDMLGFVTSLITGIITLAIIIYISWRNTLVSYLLFYDEALNKSKDVSHLYTVPEKALEPSLNVLANLGFQRFGEVQTVTGLDSVAIVEYWMINNSQEILLEIAYMEQAQMTFARFSTWFKKQHLVETEYPMGLTVKKDNYWSEAISTSLESTFLFHTQQIAAFEQLHGKPRIIDSIDNVFKLQSETQIHHSDNSKSYQWRNIFSRFMFSLSFSAVTFLTPAAYNLALSGFNIDSPIVPKMMQTIVIVVIGWGLSLLPTPKGRDISQAKKKAA